MGRGIEMSKSLDRLLLMSCRSPFLDDSKIYAPMGNLYLKSFVNEHLPHVDVTLGDDEYGPETDFSKYDAVGISIMTPQRAEADKLAELVKKSSWRTKVIVGGPHVKHYLKEVISNPRFDFIVHGDGEKGLVGILDGASGRLHYSNMSKDDIRNAPRPDRSSENAVNLIKGYSYTLGDREATTMMTGRGCPEMCTFCFVADTRIMTPKGWRLIKDLRKNSEVLTFNEKTGKVEKGKIKKTFKRKEECGLNLLKIWFGSRKYIITTPEHPFYQHGKWVQAKDLEAGDILHTLKSQVMEESIEKYSKCKMGDKNPMKRPEVIAKANSKENYEKRRKNGFGIVSPKPNNSEQKLIELIKESKFEFTGNKPIRIEGFNPDFVHKEKRKIIELYGCYWHNCKTCKRLRKNHRNPLIESRDEYRMNCFKEAGYETLTIWEHELKDELAIIKKVWNFETNGSTITHIVQIVSSENVYNFECDNNTYFAEGVLVHNCEDAQTSIKWSSLDNLRGEMDDIKAMGYEGVYIFDDLFAISKKMVTPIVEELSKRDLIFRANAQARYFTRWGEDMAKLLAENGCREIAFGAESGSQKILDNIQKRCTVEQNYQTVEFAKKHGINVKAFILLGLPGEDVHTLAETEKFIANSGIDDFQAAIYMPYKGTQIRDAIDRGESVGLEMTVTQESGAYGVKGGNTVSEVRTEALSSEDLQRFRDYLVEKYKPKAHDKFFETHEAEQ